MQFYSNGTNFIEFNNGRSILGNIPTSLGQLTQLQLLGLQNNLFRNEIPREIWTLKELSAIYLDGNRLTGTIPTEVENLDKLLDFRLRNNRMKGSLPSSLGTLSEFFRQITSFDAILFACMSHDRHLFSHALIDLCSLRQHEQLNCESFTWIITNSMELYQRRLVACLNLNH